MFSYFDHLECSACSRTFEKNTLINLCPCGGPILARYRLGEAALDMDRSNLPGHGLWRYHAVLPVGEAERIVTLGEGMTPLLRAGRLGRLLGLESLSVQNDALNPTGAFKDLGFSVAVSRAAELGVQEVALPSAGNAGSAAAAYSARAGLKAHVFFPKDVPKAFLTECKYYGAHVELVDGRINDAGKRVAEECKQHGWFDLSTLKEPYRLEGKKYMGYRLAEQLGWELPDVIIYPTGGGTGLVGMWKSFEEMEAMGWLGSIGSSHSRRPRMVTVQAAGCAPIVRAFETGAERAELWENAETIAAGLRVPAAVGDRLMLRALRESNGTAVAVAETDILDGVKLLAQSEGIFASPEAGAAVAGLRQLAQRGWVKPEERVVLFNTGSALKYLDVLDRD
jgi:threonine synthase